MSVKISQLPVATSPTGAELLPIVQGGVTKETSIAALGTGVSYTPAYGGLPTTMFTKLSQYISVFDYLTTAQIANVIANTPDDLTTPIQTAINTISNTGGGIIYFPTGTYKGNWTIKSYVILQGAGINSTTFKPAINDHVFKTAMAAVTSRSYFSDLQIIGNVSFTTSDGIHMETSGALNYVDDIGFTRVMIQQCCYGLYAFGTSSGGPFVQAVHVNSSNIVNNKTANVYYKGCVLETSFHACALGGVTDTTQDVAEVNLLEETSSYTRPYRTSFSSCIFGTVLSSAYAVRSVYITGCNTAEFYCCDFEFSPCFIYTAGTNEIGSLGIRSCYFEPPVGATEAIYLSLARGPTDISNNWFNAHATLAHAIFLLGGSNGANYCSVKNNRLSGNISKEVEWGAYYQGTIGNGANGATSGAIVRQSEFIEVIPVTGATGTLSRIVSPESNNTTNIVAFEYGAIVTVAPAGSKIITVHSDYYGGDGSIVLSGNSDFVMDFTTYPKTLTLRFHPQLKKWLEIGRMA